MKTRYVAIAAVVAAGALGLAACGGGTDQPAGAPNAPVPAEPSVDAGGAGGTFPAGQVVKGSDFVGMTLDQASSFAEELGRQWRVGSEDGVDLPVTADLIPGRVTFTVEDGVVTAATIEEEDGQIVLPPDGAQDRSRAELLARAIERLVTVDNTFGGGDPFDVVEVAAVIGGNREQPVEPLARELIAAAIEPVAVVDCIPDAKESIDRYFDGTPEALAVVSVDDLRIEGERAEIDLALWCGSLCGTWLTYEAELGPDGWEILGTTGPIAIS
jgi:hypothetical protein